MSEQKSRLIVDPPEGLDEHEESAWAVLQPKYRAAITAYCFSQNACLSDIDPSSLADQLEALQAEVVERGSLEACEGLLAYQAHLLNLIFNETMQKSWSQDTFKGLSLYANLGMKAQAQCRQTIETLAALKNPHPSVVKQTNISAGHQQINNGERSIEQNELLPSRKRSSMEALGIVHRAAQPQRKGSCGEELTKVGSLYEEGHNGAQVAK